ncbi:RNA polymerase sigma factor [Pedosphaera parvula]|uniref:RNA polymerase sigma factor n=1 Tax=Pedosphaera parvula TaxID=1032527 RepID=UPI00135F1246|nr:sigma-70 family RNA polymerase sigma factor [Pedosphaera parvula]
MFFDTYWKLIYTAALKAGLNDAEAQDVVQETVLSVLKSMPTFEYDSKKGSFKGWLLRLTNWRITDQMRKRERNPEFKISETDFSTDIEALEALAPSVPMELESIWEEEWERNLLEAATERVKKKVDSKQYQIFDLHVLKDWPVIKVSRFLKINPGKVYLAKHRIGKLIAREIEILQTKPL